MHRKEIFSFDIFSPEKKIIMTDALVMGHVNPDLDSLCASIAIAKELRSNGKKSYVFVDKNYPKNVAWLVQENKDIIIFDANDSFCKNVNYLYIVDCQPSKERTGFTIDKFRHKWFNIDHHCDRFNDFKHKTTENVSELPWLFYIDEDGNSTFIGRHQSVCAIMVDVFGFKTDVLGLGIYSDTVGLSIGTFSSAKAISKLETDDEDLEAMIAKSRFTGNREEYEALIAMQRWWTSDSTICVIYDPSNTLDKTQMISSVRPYCTNLISVSKSKNVAMRSFSQNVDLSKIARLFDGGGHVGASGFKIKQIGDLHSVVTTLYEQTVKKPLPESDLKSLEHFLGLNNKNAQLRVFLGI
jgi:phosphoesterase RecJ-like protein